MTASAAKDWATFLKKLGCKATKKHIIDHIISHDMSKEEAWDCFVEQHSDVKEAANVNLFYNADDVAAYFREISYAKMRGTFPRRHHGRTFVVPRLKTIQEIQSEKEEAVTQTIVKPKEKFIATKSMVGMCVLHTTFGQGVITEVIGNDCICIDFRRYGKKMLSYEASIKMGVLTCE